MYEIAVKTTLKKTKSKQGLTLIELIIVVGILSILALIIIPNGMEVFKKSRLSQMKADTRILTEAAHAYASDHRGVLPAYNSITINNEETEKVIQYALRLNGVHPSIYSQLNAQYFKRLDRVKLKGYIKGGTETMGYFVVDNVPDGKISGYNNELAGEVFKDDAIAYAHKLYNFTYVYNPKDPNEGIQNPDGNGVAQPGPYDPPNGNPPGSNTTPGNGETGGTRPDGNNSGGNDPSGNNPGGNNPGGNNPGGNNPGGNNEDLNVIIDPGGSN